MKKQFLMAIMLLCFTSIAFGQGANWKTNGNSGISATEYLGTNDNASLIFKTNNQERMRMTSPYGFFGFGTAAPTARFDMVIPSLNYAQVGIRITSPVLYSLSVSGPELVPELFELRKQTATGGFSTHFIVRDNGNTGIGTNLPSYKLHIKNPSTSSGTALRIDAINGQIRLFETDGSNPESYTQIERNGDAFHIYQRDITSTSFMHVFSAAMNGNVGFGDGSPHPDFKMFVLNNQKNVGLCINNLQTTNNGYGLRCIVNNVTTKSLAVTNSDDGLDVFRVMGNGVVWCTELNVDVKGDFPDYVFNEGYNLLPLDELQKYVKAKKHLPNFPSASEVEENGIAVSKMAVMQTEKVEELTLYLFQLNESIKKLIIQNEELQKRIIELESK